MEQDRVAARDALVATTTRIGLAVLVLSAAATGGVAGALARADRTASTAAPVPAGAATQTPKPRRTVYVQLPPPAAAPARRTPVPPPRRTQQAPVTRSDGS